MVLSMIDINIEDIVLRLAAQLGKIVYKLK